MGCCKDCINGEKYYTGQIYCSIYKGLFDPYDGCKFYNLKTADSSDEVCFITTACVSQVGHNDSCYELQILRNFRNDYLIKTKEGRQDIEEYYKNAPKIVEMINCQPDRKEIYDELYYSLVLKSINLIEEKRYVDAYENYKNIYQMLLEKFIK
jgi:hypothetical protein